MGFATRPAQVDSDEDLTQWMASLDAQQPTGLALTDSPRDQHLVPEGRWGEPSGQQSNDTAMRNGVMNSNKWDALQVAAPSPTSPQNDANLTQAQVQRPHGKGSRVKLCFYREITAS